MNNYCTNCGKKLKENEIKCDQCNTYIIDLKVTNKKKIFKVVCIVIFILILGIILSITCYNLYYKNLNKSLYKKYLLDDFKDAQYVGYDSCRACDGSCDGSCITSPKIVGCFKYYYKSKSNIENADIVIFSNKGDISIDTYSSIINKYGFEENLDDDDDRYQTKKRSYLYIYADYINNNNISNIYKMANEIIEIYKKDDKDFLYIMIFDNRYSNDIRISNENTSNKYTFEWEFYNDIRLLNPTLNDVKNMYNSFNNMNKSLNNGDFYND